MQKKAAKEEAKEAKAIAKEKIQLALKQEREIFINVLLKKNMTTERLPAR
ncbi:MAG: hypothetical protein WAN92_06650 [Herbaspirillum sp.]